MLFIVRCYLAWIRLPLTMQLQVDFLIVLCFEGTDGSIARGLSQISRWCLDHLKEHIIFFNVRCYLAWIRLPLAMQLQVDFLIVLLFEGTDGSIAKGLS